MNESDPGSIPPSAARGITALIVANASLLIAVLVYMGWAYEAAFLGYFHLNPFDLDVGIVEYMLRSLTLFSPNLIIAVVVVLAVTTVCALRLDHTAFVQRVTDKSTTRISTIPVLRRIVGKSNAKYTDPSRWLLIGLGAAATVIALILVWVSSYFPIKTYLILALLGGGPLLLTWPTRAERRGRFPYSLAIVITAVCALWATATYANNVGTQDARAVVRYLPWGTAVVVYSTQRLALSGPGVTVQQLPSGALYHYEYQGLRLLVNRSGTYYLLPVGWYPQMDITYIINESDQIRIVLLSGVVRPHS